MRAKQILPLPPLEWQIMRCVWDLGSADPIEVTERLPRLDNSDRLSPKTVGVLLKRLVDKGYLRFKVAAPRPATPAADRRSGGSPSRARFMRGRPRHVYSPLVSHEDALRLIFERFVHDFLFHEGEFESFELFLAEREQVKKHG